MPRHKLPEELKKVRVGATIRLRPYDKEFLDKVVKITPNDLFKEAVESVIFNHPEYRSWLNGQSDLVELMTKNGIERES